MACKQCNKRNTCEEICPKVENIISEKTASRRELPLPDHFLVYLVEDHWRANRAEYLDRHSGLLPELHRRMERLTPKQGRVIRMYFLEEMSIPEIAARLKVSPQAVFDRLQRAMNRLQSENGRDG